MVCPSDTLCNDSGSLARRPEKPASSACRLFTQNHSTMADVALFGRTISKPGGEDESMRPILTAKRSAPGGGSRHFSRKASRLAAARAKAAVHGGIPFRNVYGMRFVGQGRSSEQ